MTIISTDGPPMAVVGAAQRGGRPGRGLKPGQLKLCVVAVDALAVGVAMTGAYVITRTWHPFDAHGAGPMSLLIAVLCLPLWLGIFARYGLYKARRVSARLDEVGALVHATVVSTLMMAAFSFLLKEPVSRGWLILCFPTGLVATLIGREIVRANFLRLRRSGRLLRKVVVIGANGEAEWLCELLAMPSLGYDVVGVVDDGFAIGHDIGPAIAGGRVGAVPVLGPIADTAAVVAAAGASGVMVATTAITAATSNWLVRELVDAGVHVEMSTSLQGIFAGRLRVRPLGTTPVIYVEPVHRGGWRAAAKRSFDLVAAGASLIVLAPTLAMVAVAIRLEGRGPVFFSQTRVGRLGEPFKIIKFRSMVPNAEALMADLEQQNEADGPLFKMKLDPRVTRVGRILRRTSLDELPQLFNVLRGEMSLVGPRPALYAEMDAWIPELRERLRVRPGLTGMWQVSGRSDLGFADYIRHDLYYVENWSLWCDLAILAKTIPVLLRSRGAY